MSFGGSNTLIMPDTAFDPTSGTAWNQGAPFPFGHVRFVAGTSWKEKLPKQGDLVKLPLLWNAQSQQNDYGPNDFPGQWQDSSPPYGTAGTVLRLPRCVALLCGPNTVSKVIQACQGLDAFTKGIAVGAINEQGASTGPFVRPHPWQSFTLATSNVGGQIGGTFQYMAITIDPTTFIGGEVLCLSTLPYFYVTLQIPGPGQGDQVQVAFRGDQCQADAAQAGPACKRYQRFKMIQYRTPDAFPPQYAGQVDAAAQQAAGVGFGAGIDYTYAGLMDPAADISPMAAAIQAFFNL